MEEKLLQDRWMILLEIVLQKCHTCILQLPKNQKKRILQLGENQDKVFNIGSLSLENIKKLKTLSKKILEEKYNIKLKNKIALISFHPDTLEKKFSLKNIKKILSSFKKFSEYSFIFTGSNLDKGGEEITEYFQSYCKKNNFFFINSLGRKDYLSILKLAFVIIGNSSSGIIEAPAFKTFTINIGNRQNGREQSKSIFNCNYDQKKFIRILKYIHKLKKKDKYFKNYPYKGHKNAINKIINIIQKPISERYNYKIFNERYMKQLFINKKATIKDALLKISKSGHRCLLVTDNLEKMLGTISDGDLRRAILKNQNLGQKIDKIYKKSKIFLQ